MAEKSERAQREEEILKFWKENKIFEKTLDQSKGEKEFVFYDGPPFATGLPHYGSLLSSIIKDVIPRYKTMRGFHVRRRWGWDCHGLPIENMVEKELGIKDKKGIEEMGVAKFNKACRDSVLRFADEWKRFIDRVGRFVDYDNSYKTMDNTYIESVWWALKEIHSKGLLYEGRKVLLYCPHCETPLAKAEIAMDQSYKDITEESVYVKFKVVGEENTYLLAWTTTPWTLPGNVALAVGTDIDYVKVKLGNETFIIAESKISTLGAGEVVEKFKGRKLEGLEYESLYNNKPSRIAIADFVTTEEGTGIVHIAPMYGEDDYALGLKLDLPMVPLLDAAGHFNNKVPEFIQGQYFKKAEKFVKDDLESRKLLFRREMHTHSYPHCHRCGTTLLYNALSSWFINIQNNKSRMLALNEKINWIPEHLKHGRFLNNLENAPDWTISRNRYWASPLPIWKDAGGKVYVIGSLTELKKFTKKSGNKYFVMRHAEASNNAKHILDLTGDPENHLTENGKEEARRTALNLKGKKIDLIVSSPFLRTQETARILQKELNLSDSAIITDERLHEIGPEEDGPSVRQRMGACLFEIEKQYADKNILILSHGFPIWSLSQVAACAHDDWQKKVVQLGTAEFMPLSFVPYPHNENFELDLHRPYIDEIELVSEESKPLKRIPEVIDGWVESGSMPFAEHHYPFENKEIFEKNFPGDFVAEYIAQTRTWFYYMHAMATNLFDNVSFKNVVTTGNVLAKDGSKMSKSKGNYTNPMDNFDLYSADALRYYLMSSVVMQAEDLEFSDDEYRQAQNQVVNILWNTFKFYELYKGENTVADYTGSENVLDKWIIARLNELTEEVTRGFESYDTVKATRPIKDFVSDLSTWYIRRSRDRFKSENLADKASAMSTTRHVLIALSKLIAPVMPFIAEDIYQKLRKEGKSESVHLCEWPTVEKSIFDIFKKSDKKILEDMTEVRRLVSLALEARAKANIKVRQPLRNLKIKNQNVKLGQEYLKIIKDEINVKEVVADKNITEEVELDTTLTPELLEEGNIRDVIRSIQEWRKVKGLQPGQKVKYEVMESREFYLKHKEVIEKATQVELV